ncbi:MAG TPA: M3 family metallopeptidase, partial [Caulobacteraceae bacterium]
MRANLLVGAACAALLTGGCATMSAEPAPAPAPALPTAEAAPAPAASANPLLAEWSGAYGGTPDFTRVRAEDFPAAFEEALAMRRREIAAITGNPEPATFDNTVLALERSGSAYSRVGALFGIYTGSMADEAYQRLDEQLAPVLAAAGDEVILNTALFRRFDAIWNGPEKARLNPEQLRLLTRYHEQFVRNGAQLDDAQKAELTRINGQLATLFAQFSSKLLADENTWTVISDEADLAGLPDSVKAAARAAAQERNVQGWAIVNTRSSVDPFLTYSTNRRLREAVWRKFVNRGDNGDASDTNATVREILRLRAERAHLLGFPTFAHWSLSDKMAKTPEAAMALMERVWTPAVARVREEVRDMQAIADREPGPHITIEPWDYRFYAEKVRKARYDLDQNELKPYFELNRMIEASMWSAGQLYGLTFNEVTGRVPTFHPDVRVWEVKDKDGRFIGLFYGDYFARAGKRSGAWENAYRSQSRLDREVTPLVSNNNNFVGGAPGEPVLISLDDAQTLFHEFGHALHDLLSNVTYESLAGTRTATDFVEFPSQVNEYWVLTRPVLDRFARHYQTGEAMPQALLDKVEAASTFNQGFATVEYLASARVDMALHMVPDGNVDPDAFERQELERIGMPREIVMRHRTPQFGHLFSSDGYAAGYYAYLWSETRDADAREAFVEAGDPFDPATAARMRTLLATGGSRDEAETFRTFRGRDPNVDALLRKRG